MRTLFFSLFILALVALPCRAQTDALSLLIARADLVVVATHTHPVGLDFRSGTSVTGEEFAVVSVLAGPSAPKTVTVRFERSLFDPHHPFTPGQRVVLFLTHGRPDPAVWELADSVLGCQNDTHTLEDTVAVLAPKSP